MIIDTINFIKKKPLLLFILIPAWILTLIPILFDGQMGCVNEKCGFIVGTNYRDGIWFQAVAETSFRTFPFQMPNFAGENLRGYHYLPNFLTYILTFIGIPVSFTFYKILPIIYMTGITILGLKLAKLIQNDLKFVMIFIFFLLYGMHLSLFTSLYHFGEIRNGALINTFQSTRILESPHFALALLGLLYIVCKLYSQKINKKNRLIFGLILFLTLGTKFYVAFSIGVILGIYELFTLFKTRDFKKFTLIIFYYGIITISAVILFYDPFTTSETGQIFSFAPFAVTHHLIESPDLFKMQNLVLARYYLYEAGWSPRLILIELFSSFLFLLFYFGTRFFAFLFFLSKDLLKNMKTVEKSIAISVFASIFMSIFFVQKGDWFNTIQFSVPAAYLSVIFLSKWIHHLLIKNKIIGVTLVLILVATTLPANLVNLNYLQNSARYVIASEEMEALLFLKKQPKGTVFSPKNEHDMAYISAFSGQVSYLTYVSHLANAGYDSSSREKLVEDYHKNIEKINTNYFYLNLNTHPLKVENSCITKNYYPIYDKSNIRICKRK